MIKCTLLISLCFLLPVETVPLYAQLKNDTAIVKIKERAYKLVQMDNGDLVPFVAVGRGNSDQYFANGRPTLKIFLDSYGQEFGRKVYHSYGDTLLVTKEYDKNGKLKKMDSVIFVDKIATEAFYEEYNYSGELAERTQYRYTDSVMYESTFTNKEWTEKITRPTRLDSATILNITTDLSGNILDADTVTRHYYPDGQSYKVTFRRPEHFNYTIQEYGLDKYGNIISGMSFYNKDTIGDHIDCFLRDIEYKGEKKPPVNRSTFYGYWVMTDGYRYWYLKENGQIEMTRLGREKIQQSQWGWDEKRHQVYIVLKPEEIKEMGEYNIIGNRLYLEYNAEDNLLIFGDNEYQKRPVLKRPRRN